MCRKAFTLVVFTAILIVFFSMLWAGDERPWFDLENCEFCKHLMKDPELLNNSDWEHHKIDNGLVTVTTVRDEYMPSFLEAMEHMQETADRLMKGEQVYMCGMCEAMGALMMKGVKWDMVQTNHGSIDIMTSDDPELVKEIHAFADKTEAEMAKMMQMWEEEGEPESEEMTD
jgi:hypothetical protein